MTDKTNLAELHKKAVDRFNIIDNLEITQRELAVEDRLFINKEGGQWNDEVRSLRTERPTYQIDRVSGSVDQVVGDQRESRRTIKVLPASNDADEKTADVFNGQIRQIEKDSSATNIYDSAYTESVSGGFGGWRVLTEFNDDDMFEQDIVMLPIESAESSLYFDPAAIRYDKRDAKYAFLVKYLPLEVFKDVYPEASVTDFDQTIYREERCSNWFLDDSVRIAEYWVKVPKVKTIALMSDKTVIDVEEEKQVIDDLALQGVTILQTRKVESHEIFRYIINGAEVLQGPDAWVGKHIPLIPLYGKTAKIRNETFVSGLVRKSKDAQRIYNYFVSSGVEAVALTPKDPLWYTNKQAVGNKAEWENFTEKNSAFLPYNHDPQEPGPPSRTGVPGTNQAAIIAQEAAKADIYTTTGIEPASHGVVPELKSGKAILAQQAMGDRGSFIYSDNLSKSIAYTGEILVDLIQKLYDGTRAIRIIKPDETTEMVTINESVVDAETGETVIVNDLSTGKYDVSVSSGPAYSTKRRESAEQMIELTKISDVIQEVGIDLIVKNLDIVENDELTERVRRKMIATGAATPTEEETKKFGLDQNQVDPQQQALLDNVLLQNTKLEADIENKDADTINKNIDSQKQTVSAFSDLIDAMIRQTQAGMPLTPEQRDNLIKQSDIISQSQEKLLPGPNNEQAQDIINNPLINNV